MGFDDLTNPYIYPHKSILKMSHFYLNNVKICTNKTFNVYVIFIVFNCVPTIYVI